MEFLFQTIFRSPKTTIAGIIGAVVWFAGQYGVVVSKEVADAAVIVTMFFVGILAKDATTSHTQE